MTTPMNPWSTGVPCHLAGARVSISSTRFSNSSSLHLRGMVSAVLLVLVVVEGSVVTVEGLVVVDELVAGGLVVEVVLPAATARASYFQMTVQAGAFDRPAWICMVAPGEAEGAVKLQLIEEAVLGSEG